MQNRDENARSSPTVRRVSSVKEITDAYEVLEKIGTGGFSTVARARDRRTGAEVAIKVVDKSKYAPTDRSFDREVAVLSEVRHENVVELYATYVTERNVFMVCELVTGGELLDRVSRAGSFTEDEAKSVIRQVLSAVAHMHARNIVHRDLKLENILLSDAGAGPLVKLIDFGLARFKPEGQTLRTICGSPLYIAPEILELETSKNEDECYSTACDMWSVGVILFALLSGYSPFDDEDESVLYQNIRNGIYHLEPGVWDFISNPAKSLVAGLLETDPNERLSAEQALAHEWLRTAETHRDAPRRTETHRDQHDIDRAERLKQQAEFIRMVREEEALALRQARRVDGGGVAEEGLFRLDE
jgi:serine/threonine protein kinase